MSDKSPSSSAPPIEMHVHGDARIDGILELIEAASSRGDLHEVLQQMCGQVASIAHAEVVSAYVREERDDGVWLVLRANVGFPDDTIGKVTLRPGEGITGCAAERMRPVSAAIAEQDTHYRHVPELGEEHYPSFLSIPLVIGGVAVGVLNLQRKETSEFSPAEVALCTVLATPFALAIDRVRNPGGEPAQEAGRSARLVGQPLAPGRAMGLGALLPTFGLLTEPTGPGAEAAERATTAIVEVEAKVAKAVESLKGKLTERDLADLAARTIVLSDQRLKQLVQQHTAELGVVAGLKKVARDYVAAPYKVGSGEADPWLQDRADAIEDLCLWVALEASDQPKPHPGSVLLSPDRVNAFVVLAASQRNLVGFAVGTHLERDSLGVRMAIAAGMPMISDLRGLFAWARAGDTMLIDGDTGVLRVNPSASIIARFRHEG